MKKISFVTLLIWITLYSCSPTNSNETIIKGEIKGVVNSMVKLRKYELDPLQFVTIDSVFAKNDLFEFKINFNTGLCVDIYVEEHQKQSRLVFLESGELVTLTGEMKTLSSDQYGYEVFDLQVKGAKSNEELLQKEIDILKNGNSLAYFEEIIKNNPTSLLTPGFILMSRNNDHYYNGLDPRVKNSYYGEKVYQRLESGKKTAAGQKAFNFSCRDVNGQTVSLKDIESKYTLLDFWASWCKPCREGHPELIQLYNRYDRTELEIVGISHDDNNIDKWKRAIKEDSIGMWLHIIEDCDTLHIPKSYNVQSIPTKIIVDRNGIIIKRFETGSSKDYIIYVDSLLTE